MSSLFQLLTINEKMEAEMKSLSTSDVSSASSSASSSLPDRPLTAEITSLREENVTLLSRMNSDRESAQRELTGLKKTLRRATEDNEALKGHLEKYVPKFIKRRRQVLHVNFGNRIMIQGKFCRLGFDAAEIRRRQFTTALMPAQTSISISPLTSFPQGSGCSRARRTEIP